MRKEISTLTRSLTTLTHKMVDKSSRCGGGRGYKSNGDYKTEESEKENTRPRNTWTRTKQNHNALEEAKPNDAKLSSNWKYNPSVQYKDEWRGEQKKWFSNARRIMMREMKSEDPKRWKKPQKKNFQQKLAKLES